MSVKPETTQAMSKSVHEINGILFHNNQVVIPSTLRKEMLNRIHDGHL